MIDKDIDAALAAEERAFLASIGGRSRALSARHWACFPGRAAG